MFIVYNGEDFLLYKFGVDLIVSNFSSDVLVPIKCAQFEIIASHHLDKLKIGHWRGFNFVFKFSVYMGLPTDVAS